MQRFIAGIDGRDVDGREATDAPAAVASHLIGRGGSPVSAARPAHDTIQRKVFSTMTKMWKHVGPGVKQKTIEKIVNGEPALKVVYKSVKNHLNSMDFVYTPNTQPIVDSRPTGQGLYRIQYGTPAELQGTDYADPQRFVGAILHEMMHVVSALEYQTNIPAQPHGPAADSDPLGHLANMHLPVRATGEKPKGPGDKGPDDYGLTPGQRTDPALGGDVQLEAMSTNWTSLLELATADLNAGNITDAQFSVIESRIQYAFGIAPIAHYDPVLFDLLYYMKVEGMTASTSYRYVKALLVEANNRRAAQQGAVAVVPKPQ